MDPRKAEESLELLQDKLQVFTEVKTNCELAEEHIKVQTQNTERLIKEQFKKLLQFLQEEEEVRINELREEQKQKSQMIKEKIEGLNGEISILSNTIRAIEEELRIENITQRHKNTVERFQFTQQDPQMDSEALIDEVRHLGNLTFRVWDKMKKIVPYTPLILDPNTANSVYTLSEDMTIVTPGEERQLPDNPERFDCYGYVLGAQGLNSGIHRWDVEVGDNKDWEIGVLAKSYQRKGQQRGQFWSICLYEGKYTIESSPGSFSYISVIQKPCRIRVQLDWDGGKLSFFDPHANTRLHTFQHTFDEALFPYIGNGDSTVPLKMLPMKISVAKEVNNDFDDGDEEYEEDDDEYEDDHGGDDE